MKHFYRSFFLFFPRWWFWVQWIWTHSNTESQRAMLAQRRGRNVICIEFHFAVSQSFSYMGNLVRACRARCSDTTNPSATTSWDTKDLRDVLALGCVGSEHQEPGGIIIDYLVGEAPSNRECEFYANNFADLRIAASWLGAWVDKWSEGP